MIHKAFKHSLLFSLLALFATVAISGCSSSTTSTPPPTTSSNVYPKTGSSYTYSLSQTDSSGNVVGSPAPINASVIDSGKTFFSQGNSYTIADDASDTTHYAYSSGNDALTYIENSGATGLLASVADSIFRRWITLSIATHAKNVMILHNDTIKITVSGASIPAVVNVVGDYIGSDSVHLASGESLFVQHCRITASATAQVSTQPLTNQRDIYFAPKIGTFAKETTVTTIPTVTFPPIKGSTTGTLQVLTSYTLK